MSIPSLDWQPISTAPANTRVLVPYRKHIAKEFRYEDTVIIAYRHDSNSGGNWIGEGNNPLKTQEPQFWLSLPTPPRVVKK